MDAWARRVSLGFRRQVPVLLQTEAAECGLACLAMIANWHGHRTDLTALRRRFAISLKGTTLRHLIDIAGQLQFACRPVRLELAELTQLRAPCVLHWDLNHFVVMTGSSRRSIRIIDPARGEQRLPLAEASRHFSGVALELQPTTSFQPKKRDRRLGLTTLLGSLRGWRTAGIQILVLALALEITVLASPFFIQWVVDGAILSSDRELLLLLALGFGLLMLIQAAISAARAWVILHASTHLSLHWNASVFAHLLHLPMTWFERRHLGDIVSRFGSVGTLHQTLTTSFIESVLDGLMAAATLTVMFFYSPALSLVALCGAFAYGALRWAGIGPLRAAAEEHIVLGAKANSVLMESLRAITPIKVFNHESGRLARWMNATVDATNRSIASEKIAILYRNIQTLLAGSEQVLIVYLGAGAVIDSVMSVGMLLAFVAYRGVFSSRIGGLIDKWSQLRMLSLHRDRLADILLEPREGQSEPASQPNTADLTLEAARVWFRYGDGEPWVLKDVSFRVPLGECVAITGGSGSGKTTLLKLLMGLLAPTQGEIRIGGVPIQRFGIRNFRSRIASVMQEDALLAGSIAENITFFDLRPDRTRVEACARIAAIHDEIAAMPMDYETLVGDMGSSLSGGQKQRILLARALYKRPDLLFLDEATSHLDERRETLINESVRTLLFTRIMVAHRAHTIASAGRVIVLEDGTIAQDLRVSPDFASSFPRVAQPD